MLLPADRVMEPWANEIAPLSVLPTPPLRKMFPTPAWMTPDGKLTPAWRFTDQPFASVICEPLLNMMLPPACKVSCPTDKPVLWLKFQIVLAVRVMFAVAWRSMAEKFKPAKRVSTL